jgi:hypothetical protein
MNKNLNKKISSFLLKSIMVFGVFLVFNLFFLPRASAAILTLTTSKETMHQQEEFKVAVSLLPGKNENINAFDLSISYSSNLTFLSSQNGSSITGFWVEKPNLKDGLINFSGIIPGGFKGLIDPMISNSLNNQKPGLITELIFVGKSEGPSIIGFNKQTTLANDGLGTILGTSSSGLLINIDNKIIPSTLNTSDETPPEPFMVTLSQDPLLFGGKYVINFETKDKESGVSSYEIKEEGSDWQKGESPYVTKNQPPKGTIFVKAIDFAGNSTTEEITPNIPTKEIPVFPVVVILTGVALIGALALYLKQKISTKV